MIFHICWASIIITAMGDYLFEYKKLCYFWLTDATEIAVLRNQTRLCDSHIGSVNGKKESGEPYTLF